MVDVVVRHKDNRSARKIVDYLSYLGQGMRNYQQRFDNFTVKHVVFSGDLVLAVGFC